MQAIVAFIDGASQLPDTHLTVISQDPAERIPAHIRERLAGHWRIDNVLDAGLLADAARHLERSFGKASGLIGALEQLQVPLAVAREGFVRHPETEVVQNALREIVQISRVELG